MPRSPVRGVKQTVRNIRSMRSIQRPISEASRFALLPMASSAKSNLVSNGNIKTGELARSIKVKKLKGSKTGVDYVVGATGKGIKKAHLVEFGTDPHWQPKRGRMHPGARAFPFLTPAFEDNDDVAVKRFGKKIGPALEAQAARLGRRR